MIRIILCLIAFVSALKAFAGTCEWGCDGDLKCLAKCAEHPEK